MYCVYNNRYSVFNVAGIDILDLVLQLTITLGAQ